MATHLRAGQITAERVSCTGLTFRITVTVYIDTQTGVQFGGRRGENDILNFGDNSDPDNDGRIGLLVPETTTTPRPDLGQQMGIAYFTVEHTYPGPGKYIISYVEPNRNQGVLNIANSISTTFYIESMIVIDPFFGCNNTPELLIPPIDQACVGAAFFHNPGAFDSDGDSLSYEFVIPFRDRNQTVSNYRDPNNQDFYTNFPAGNETGTGPPTFNINGSDGTLIWDAPGAQGEYNIAFVVKEWRRINGTWFQLGFVRRDMQIIVSDCNNDRPDLIIPNDVCVEAGTLLTERIFGIDPDGHDVKIEAFSEIFNFPSNQSPARITPLPQPNDFRPSPAETLFEWETTCSHVKAQPYQVVFKVIDNPPQGPKLVTFRTWRITVIAPPPQPLSATTDLVNRSATITWEPYVCAAASGIQIWRRVGQVNFVPDSCETGIPDNLGYSLLGTVPVNESSFLDTNNGNGLAIGARYCYRFVAVFPLPKGGESYVSQQICTDPIQADAPVITHVSIERTNDRDGEVRISWRSPFEIDPVQFPPEAYGYNYVVQRSQQPFGSFVNIHSGQLQGDTTVLDVGLDTRTTPHYYRVLLIVPSLSVTIPVDTSSVASSVWLSVTSSASQIDLNWAADVPWSNLIVTDPNHEIFRAFDQAETHEEVAFLNTVNVFERGFNYADLSLDDNTTYCYQVITKGGYDNPSIDEPIRNFSQIICVRPNDTSPPCIPEIQVTAKDCNDYFIEQGCNVNVFQNELRWTSSCKFDVSHYRVYAANQEKGEYFLLKDLVRDTFYLDQNLSSPARCYRITAIDLSGNESVPSDTYCFDTCPYYELPNVFTPNGDGCNDRFYAWGYLPSVGEESEGSVTSCPEQNPGSEEFRRRCAKFVQAVEFKVFNRWGEEIFTYRGSRGSENTIYIGWDGRNNQGSQLASGIYYYTADVTFDTSNPEKLKQLIKGWVHLIR